MFSKLSIILLQTYKRISNFDNSNHNNNNNNNNNNDENEEQYNPPQWHQNDDDDTPNNNTNNDDNKDNEKERKLFVTRITSSLDARSIDFIIQEMFGKDSVEHSS